MAHKSQKFSRSGPVHIAGTNWNYTQHRTSITASLVQGVNVLEEDRQHHRKGNHALAPPWWNSFNFQLLPQVLTDDSDSSIFGAIYRFGSQYVVAFRGTLLTWRTLKQDITMNLQFLFEQHKLQNSSRVEKALRAVRELVDRAGAANVLLAGHSLGSIIALLVGRNIAKMGFLVETYLFNPPFSSLSIPLDLLIKNKIIKFGLRFLRDTIRAVLSAGLLNYQPSQLDQNDPFTMLMSWTPHLFVNQKDLICSQYISYFEHRRTMASVGASAIGRIATQTSVRRIFAAVARGTITEPYHLLPTAYLVKNLDETRKASKAHKLEQWWSRSLAVHRELQNF